MAKSYNRNQSASYSMEISRNATIVDITDYEIDCRASELADNLANNLTCNFVNRHKISLHHGSFETASFVMYLTVQPQRRKEPRKMGKRPAHLKPPAHLSKSPPVPQPAPMVRAAEPDPDRLDPVRYGDWELKGVAVDF